MSNKIVGIITTICLVVIAAPLLAQSVEEYILADDAMYYFFDSRIVTAPTPKIAVVFFYYYSNPDPVTRIGKVYIKSLVVSRRGKPRPATILAHANWVYDGGAPAEGRKKPMLVDVIWNNDRKGFDLFLLRQRPSEPGKVYQEKLFMLPLDERGRSTDRRIQIREYDTNGGYEDFIETRKFASGPGGRRLLMTMNDETNNVRLHLFDMGGGKLVIKDHVLGNNTSAITRYPITVVNYGPHRFCLYSSFRNNMTNEVALFAEIIDGFNLDKLPGAKNIQLTSKANYATFAGGSHLFYTSLFDSNIQRYSAAFHTIGEKGNPASPMKFMPIGRILAVQNAYDKKGDFSAFNMFTIKEHAYPKADRIYLTKIDKNGKIITKARKLFEIEMSPSSHMPNNYAIAETVKGYILFVHDDKLYVRSPR